MTDLCHFRLPNLGGAEKISYLRNECDCHPRYNCTQDAVRR